MKKKSRVSVGYFEKPKMTKHVIYKTDALVVEVEDIITIEDENDAFSPGSCNRDASSKDKTKTNDQCFQSDEDGSGEDERSSGSLHNSNAELEDDEKYPLFINLDKEMECDEDNVAYIEDYDEDSSFIKNLLEPETMIVEYEDPIELSNEYPQGTVIQLAGEFEHEDIGYVLQDQNENVPHHIIEETNSEVKDQYCFTCGKYFDTESKYKCHLNSHKKPQTCLICRQRLDGVLPLKEHIRIEHKKERPYHCQLCLGSFSMRTSLIIHMRSIHYQEKRFSCELCGKRFAAKQKLRWHMLNHTGEKPYTCPCCSTRFSRKDHMSRHVKTKHSLEDAVCDSSLENLPSQDIKFITINA